jgi:YggT family protein
MTLALIQAINLIINAFSILILVEVLASWVLISNVRVPDPILRVLQVISIITGILLNPIRRLVPSVGGLDLSPIIALLLLNALGQLLRSALLR